MFGGVAKLCGQKSGKPLGRVVDDQWKCRRRPKLPSYGVRGDQALWPAATYRGRERELRDRRLLLGPADLSS